MVSDYMQAVPMSTNVYKNVSNFEGPDRGVGIAMGNYSGNKGLRNIGFRNSKTKGPNSGRLLRERSLEPNSH